MNNITVRASLLGVLLLFIAMLVTGAGLGIYAIKQSNQSIALVHEVSRQVILINDAYKDTTRVRTAMMRAYTTLMENDSKEAKDVSVVSARKTRQRSADFLAKYIQAPVYEGLDPELKQTLIDAGNTLLATLDKAIDALDRGDAAAYSVVNMRDLTPTGTAFSVALEKYQKVSDQQINQLLDRRAAEYKLVMWLVVLGLLIAVGLVIGVHLMLKRIVLSPLERAVSLLDQVARGDLTAHISESGDNEIARLMRAVQRMQQDLLSTVSSVRNSAEVINTGAHELASGNMELSSRTETQASSLEETAASIEELTSTVKQNAENAQHARELVDGVSRTASRGGEVMQQVVATMTDINDSSRKIVDITGVIDGIAFQTNILALNAAVEAARAGEQGRGFAVVATEVRNLAQRSAAAAKEIKVLIDNSVEKIQLGGGLVQQAGTTMTMLVGDVQQVSQMVAGIAVASREQSEGIEQVNQAIAQMDEVTQQNAALVEEAAAATTSLQEQADELVQAVGIFKIDASQAQTPRAARNAARRHLALA